MLEQLKETSLLDFSNKKIQDVIVRNHWMGLDEKSKILSAYNFVRDDIAFGYNIDDRIPASQVLDDGIGQCNTKGILLMAFLRALDIPCRMHGFTIYKALQKGAMRGIYYRLAPKEILHSWVEVFYNGHWLNLEGFILDMEYLGRLQKKFSGHEGSFCGYGVATDDFQNPQVSWNGNDTYIQKEGIAKDFGVFNSPDEFFLKHGQTLSPIKRFSYQKLVRHLMNKNVSMIRQGGKVSKT